MPDGIDPGPRARPPRSRAGDRIGGMDHLPRRRTVSMTLLVLLVGLVAACSGGGGGGGAPQPGSDEAQAGQAKQLDEQAKNELRDALKKVDRCSPTADQTKSVFNALGTRQALGTETDADTKATQTTLQPAARAIARAFARGDATGMTGQQIENLAQWTGIDTSSGGGTGWMADRDCDWIVTVRVLSLSAVPGVTGKLEMNTRVPLQTNVITGEVSGTGRFDVTGEMQAPPPCTVTYQPATTDTTVRGQERGGKLALTLSYAAYTLNGQTVCELPGLIGRVTTPAPLPMEAMKDFAMTVEARHGATATDAKAGVTVTVTRAK